MMVAMNATAIRRSQGEISLRLSRGDWIFLILLAASMFGLYRHTLAYGLNWDTKDFARESVLLNTQRPLADAFRYGMIHGQMGEYGGSFYYRPLWNLSLMLEQRLWGFRGTGIRLVNIAIFSLSLLLLFLFLKLQDVPRELPFLATALFAFLPIQADNVVWGVSRCDLFLLLWGLLAAICFHQRLQGRGRVWVLLGALSFALGMLSKETFVLFIPFLAAYEWAWRQRLSWRRYPACILIAASFFLVKHGLLRLSSLPLRALPSLAATADLFFSTVGYYVRILLLPVGFPKFAFAAEITRPGYLLLGIGSFLACGVLLLRARPKRVLIPLALILLFLLPYVGLAFSPLWPFRISARYMMVPAIGMTWLFCLLLARMKRYLRFLSAAALIAVFLPYLLQSTFAYRDEVAYWADGQKAHPRNGTMLLLLAKAHYNAGDNLLARQCLDESLRRPTDRLTASHIAGLYANLEYLRCDYPAALNWLKHPLAVSPYNERFLRASIDLSRGDFPAAEQGLLELKRRFPEARLAYHKLFVAYVGRGEWEKAAKLEREMRAVFAAEAPRLTEALRADFLRRSPRGKAAFYAEFNNYGAACEFLERIPGKSFADRLALAELYYRSGRPGAAEGVIDGLPGAGLSAATACNAIGELYVKKLNRPEQALPYFERSIRIRPDQPQVREMIRRLTLLTTPGQAAI